MCDKHFHLDPILEMYKEESCFGIIFITGKSYSFYKIIKSGDHYENKKICSDTVVLPNKHKCGGSSSGRYGRIHDEKEFNYITKVGELVIKAYMTNNNTEYTVKKLFIAGPSEKKNMLSQNVLVQQYFKNKLILLNTPDINDQSMFETIRDAKKLFEQDLETFGDDILEHIKELMNIGDSDILVYGLNEVTTALNNQELKQIITDKDTANSLDINININLGKCEIIIIAAHKLETFGINPIGIKYY